MELYKLNDHIYYTDYEEERDRPRLGYIKGQNYSVAIDAGHSDNHVLEFYDLLKKNNLPLPSLTIITHWHWDHTFGMHAVSGKTLASKKTNTYLKEFINNRSKENDNKFLNLDPSIGLEYKNNKEIIVVTSDEEYENKLTIDLGDQIIEVIESPSPHTDDCTLVYLPKDKVIFIGDGISGVFPTWEIEKDKAIDMINFIDNYDIDISIGGHWPNQTKQELIDSLIEF